MKNARKYQSAVPRLTVNHIAAAMLKSGGKAWRGLAVGVFLSLFLISAMVMSVQGVTQAAKERVAQKLGYEECMLIDYPEMTDVQLRESGRFDQIGHVFVAAKLAEGERYFGWYDDTAATLLNRQVMEGRLPQAAGEIAVDQGLLEYLRTDAAVGDQIALNLTPIDGFAEARTCTLVGILADQPLDVNKWGSFGDRVMHFPSIVAAAEGNGFSSGRLAVHRVMTLARGVSMGSVMKNNWEQYGECMFCIDELGNLAHWYSGIDGITAYLNTTTLLVILLGLSLVLSAGVGVAQAMESQLARRLEEIGMLRAVGATRRQIRRIFGRQTWLLALGLAPFSVALGCGFAWGLSRAFPGTVAFRPTWGVLAPMLALSILCVWLSSSLPLRRAARVMPMSVIRDTRLLRKAKRVKGREAFRPALLLLERLREGANGVGYEIHNEDGFNWFQPTFSDGDAAGRFLTEGDVSQLRALPHVKDVVTRRTLSVNLLMDEVTDYLTLSNEYLAEDADWTWMGWAEENDAYRARASLVQEYLGTDKTLAQLSLRAMAMTREMVGALEGLVSEGRVDLDALDAGREVLVLAPTVCQMENGEGATRTSETNARRYFRNWTMTHRWENDVFHAGDTLDMVQLMGRSPEELLDDYIAYSGLDAAPEDFMAWIESCQRRDVSAKIGAVLKEGPSEYMDPLGLPIGTECCLITTEKGMRAMGLYPRTMDYVAMYLDGAVDEETGTYLSGRVNAIAARAESVYVYDGVAADRRRREQLTQTTLAFAAMALMFFAVTVGLVSGNASRRIRADQRMIGTLRAVGADERVLLKCYGSQIGVGLAAGLLTALALALVLFALPSGLPMGARALSVGAMVALAGLCLAFCVLALRVSLRETMGKSIVENIREL